MDRIKAKYQAHKEKKDQERQERSLLEQEAYELEQQIQMN